MTVRVIQLFASLMWASRALAADPHDCPAIEHDSERLACYDRAFGRGEIKSTAKQDVTTEFGMTPALKQKQQPAAAQTKAPDSITMLVTRAEKNADGSFTLSTDNQQTWRTVDTNWAIEFASGDEIIVKRGLSGAFYLRKSKNNQSLRARRIE